MALLAAGRTSSAQPRQRGHRRAPPPPGPPEGGGAQFARCGVDRREGAASVLERLDSDGHARSLLASQRRRLLLQPCQPLLHLASVGRVHRLELIERQQRPLADVRVVERGVEEEAEAEASDGAAQHPDPAVQRRNRFRRRAFRGAEHQREQSLEHEAGHEEGEEGEAGPGGGLGGGEGEGEEDRAGVDEDGLHVDELAHQRPLQRENAVKPPEQQPLLGANLLGAFLELEERRLGLPPELLDGALGVGEGGRLRLRERAQLLRRLLLPREQLLRRLHREPLIGADSLGVVDHVRGLRLELDKTVGGALGRGVECVHRVLGCALELLRLQVEAHRLRVCIEGGVGGVGDRVHRVDHGARALGDVHGVGAGVGGEVALFQMAVGESHGQLRSLRVIHGAAARLEGGNCLRPAALRRRVSDELVELGFALLDACTHVGVDLKHRPRHRHHRDKDEQRPR